MQFFKATFSLCPSDLADSRRWTSPVDWDTITIVSSYKKLVRYLSVYYYHSGCNIIAGINGAPVRISIASETGDFSLVRNLIEQPRVTLN